MSKIKLDDGGYIDVSISDGIPKISIKTSDKNTHTLVTAELDYNSLEKLISHLVVIKPKVKDEY